MPTRAQADLPADPRIMRAIVREGHNLGVYAAVVEPGEVRAGDPVALVD
jgi:MOSC domain-containing protein YiiM